MFLGIRGTAPSHQNTCGAHCDPNASSPTINIRLTTNPSRKHCAPHKLQWKLGNTCQHACSQNRTAWVVWSSGNAVLLLNLQAMRQRLGLPFNQPAGRHPLAYKPLRISHHNPPPLKTATPTLHISQRQWCTHSCCTFTCSGQCHPLARQCPVWVKVTM